LALLLQRSRWSRAATRNRRLRPLPLLRLPPRRTLLLRLLRLATLLLRPLLRPVTPLLRLRRRQPRRRRTDPPGSGM